MGAQMKGLVIWIWYLIKINNYDESPCILILNIVHWRGECIIADK